MDNYKIKVKDEAESKEAQELFFRMGAIWASGSTEFFDDVNSGEFILFDGKYLHVGDGLIHGKNHKDINLHNLRELAQTHLQFKEGEIVELVEDLQTRGGFETIFAKGTKGSVVSKERGSDIRIDFNGDARWCPISILKLSTQDPALISGAAALRALADGKEVEFKDGTGKWENIKYHMNLDLSMFLTAPEWMMFRLKPSTLTVNADLPKPEREFHQNTEIFSVTYEFKTREDRNAFADKLRGTNS